eukprot:gene2888-5667_t
MGYLLLVLLFAYFGSCRSSSDSVDGIKRAKVDFRLPIAGGLAGGLTNAILYPIDTLKTIRQSNPNVKSSWEAFQLMKSKGLFRMYSGILPAALGAIPSSALYFGTYESAKRILYNINNNKFPRYFIHMTSAAMGNIISSVIFVPKEVIKQQMQVIRTGSMAFTGVRGSSSTVTDVIKEILKTKGISGFYSSYLATLSRNIPSAVIRFTLYEELRLIFRRNKQLHDISYILAGAIASATSSAITTPFDVIKTKIATGVLPAKTPLITAMKEIIRREGIIGLYSGIQPRLVWSALFGGVGFACFETFKMFLNIQEIGDGDGNYIDDSHNSQKNSHKYKKKNNDKEDDAPRRCLSCTRKYGCPPKLMVKGVHSSVI